MKELRLYIFLYLFLVSSSVCAQSDNFLLITHAQHSDKFFRVNLYTKETCLQTLENFLQPEKVIKSGVLGIAGILKNNSVASQSCVNDIVKNWDTILPPPKGILSPEQLADIESEDVAMPDASEVNALQKELKCYNKYEPNTNSFKTYQQKNSHDCDKKWLTKETAAPLTKKLDLAKKKLQIEKQKYEFNKNLTSHAMEALKKTVYDEYDYPPIQSLRKQLDCYNTHAPETASFHYHEQDYKEQCNSHWLTKEQSEQIEKQIEAEKINLQEKNKEPAAYNELLENLSDPIFKLMINVEKLRPNLILFECFTAETEESEIEYFKKSKNWLCDGKITPLDKKDEALAAIQKEFANLPELIEKFKAQKTELIAIQQKKFDAANEKFIQNYSLRRLLTRYAWYLNNGGKPEKADDFCAGLEQSEQQNKLYASSELPINYFHKEDLWKIALQFGLSEAEYGAIKGYTDDFYQTINPAIWNKSLTEKLRLYVQVMNSGMNKMPAYRATLVTRFANLPPQVLEQHQVGKVVCYDAYSSSSKDPNWNWSGTGKFVIYPGNRGRPVYEISSHSSEEEVLFDQNTCFLVLAKEMKNGIDEFQMVEVDKDGHPVGQIPDNLLPKKD